MQHQNVYLTRKRKGKEKGKKKGKGYVTHSSRLCLLLRNMLGTYLHKYICKLFSTHTHSHGWVFPFFACLFPSSSLSLLLFLMLQTRFGFKLLWHLSGFAPCLCLQCHAPRETRRGKDRERGRAATTCRRFAVKRKLQNVCLIRSCACLQPRQRLF